MYKNLLFNLIITLLISFPASAQENTIRFHSINFFGLIGGESNISTAFQTVNGIRVSNWFSGVGIGIDNYKYKTLPLFFDARKYFGIDKRGFVYGDIGYNFPMKNIPGKEMIYYDNYRFKGGLYSELGVGFTMKFIRSSSISFSFAYSNKQLQSRIGVVPLCVGCDPYFYNYRLSYGRALLKTGIEF